MKINSFWTIKQFSQKHPAFSEQSLRWLKFNENTNGLKSAFKKLGRRVLIDEEEFFNCVDKVNGGKS